MRFIWQTALKDLRRHRSEPFGFIIWLGIPLVIGTLMVLASGGRGGVRPHAELLVVDGDNTLLSGALVSALSQDNFGGGIIQAEEVSIEEGLDRINDGDGSALLIIPPGFTSAILQEEPTTLNLIKNPAQRILPGIIEESVSIFVDLTWYVQRLFGDELRDIAEGPSEGGGTFEDLFVADLSVRINRMMSRVGDYLFPPIIKLDAGPAPDESTLDVEADSEDKVSVNFGTLFVPGLLIMSILFMCQSMSEDLWKERDGQTLRRVTATPRWAGSFLLGKILAAAILMFMVTLVALTLGFVYFRFHIETFPLAIIWTTFSGAVFVSGLMVIQLFVSSARAGNIVTMIIIFPLMMVGGSFFPFEAMPEGMAAIGRLTPNGWALEQMKAILFDRVEPASLARSFGALLIVGTGLFFLATSRLRRAAS